MTIEQFSGMHACDCLFFFFFFGRCYYAGLHRGVSWHRQRLEVKGGTSGWLHHAHQSTSGRRRCACKVLLCFTLPKFARLLHLLVQTSTKIHAHTHIHTHIYISIYAHKKGNRAYFFTDRQSRNNVETGKHDEVTEDGFPFSASGSPNLTELTVTRYALVLARNRRSISRIHAKHVSIIRCWSEFAMNWIDLIVKLFRLIFFY